MNPEFNLNFRSANAEKSEIIRGKFKDFAYGIEFFFIRRFFPFGGKLAEWL